MIRSRDVYEEASLTSETITGRVNDIQSYKDNREEIKTKKRNHHRYQTTWGGNMKRSNNLLKIDLDIFK